MSGQDDLQAWLEQLKQRAETKKTAGGSQAPQRRGARSMDVTPSSQKQQKKVNYGRPGDVERAVDARRREEAERTRQEQEADRKRLDEERRQEDIKRKRKRQIIEQQKRKRQEALEKQQDEVRKKAEAAEKSYLSPLRKKKRNAARSNLGLSGNLISDLRNNPAALKEAILLLETLGPPMADRDPEKRLF